MDRIKEIARKLGRTLGGQKDGNWRIEVVLDRNSFSEEEVDRLIGIFVEIASFDGRAEDVAAAMFLEEAK